MAWTASFTWLAFILLREISDVGGALGTFGLSISRSPCTTSIQHLVQREMRLARENSHCSSMVEVQICLLNGTLFLQTDVQNLTDRVLGLTADLDQELPNFVRCNPFLASSWSHEWITHPGGRRATCLTATGSRLLPGQGSTCKMPISIICGPHPDNGALTTLKITGATTCSREGTDPLDYCSCLSDIEKLTFFRIGDHVLWLSNTPFGEIRLGVTSESWVIALDL